MLETAVAQSLTTATLEAAKAAAVPALLALLAARPKTPDLLKVTACTADDPRVREVAQQIITTVGARPDCHNLSR